MGRKFLGRSGLLFLLLFSLAARAELAAGDHRFSLIVGKAERSYLVHVPPKVANGYAMPVVLDFHGGGGSGEQHRRESGGDAAADRNGYIVVYPNGSGRLVDRLLTWNAGHCCGYAQKQNIDDVGFAAALLDDLARRTTIDPRRVYAMGHSNGGMMAHRLGDELPQRFAAIASAGGARLPSVRGGAVPVLHIHSIDDPRALYDGGLGPPFPLTNSRVLHVGVDQTLAAWATRNGCKPEPERVEQRPADAAGHTAERLVWPACRAGAEVSLWRLTGAGHGWPGSRSGRESLIGPATRIIDANTEAWRFFSRFSLPR